MQLSTWAVRLNARMRPAPTGEAPTTLGVLNVNLDAPTGTATLQLPPPLRRPPALTRLRRVAPQLPPTQPPPIRHRPNNPQPSSTARRTGPAHRVSAQSAPAEQIRA